MPIINQATLSDLFIGYKANYNTGFRMASADWSKIATQIPSGTRSNHYAWLGQFPKLREWIGDRHVKGMLSYDYTIVNKKYESTISVPRDDIEDDQHGVFGPLFQEMGYAAQQHPDESIFPLLAAGSSTLCYDETNFFNASHPVGAGTQSNVMGGSGTEWYLLNTDRPLKPFIYQTRRPMALKTMNDMSDEKVFMADEFRYGIDTRMNTGYGFWQQAVMSEETLSKANFRLARARMRSFKSDEDRFLRMRPGLLVVPPSLEGVANDVILAERDASGATNTERNAVNILVADLLG